MELNNPVGPKKCQVKETQVLKEFSGGTSKIFCVDTVADNSGVPYADSFRLAVVSKDYDLINDISVY